MEKTDLELLVNTVFNNEDGIALLDMLEVRFVYTDIVQADGEVPSATRQGKSNLIRLFRKIINNIDK